MSEHDALRWGVADSDLMECNQPGARDRRLGGGGMSIDCDRWTRETGKLADVLPRASEWQYFDHGEGAPCRGSGTLTAAGLSG